METEHPKLRAAQHRQFPIDSVRRQIEALCILLDDASQDEMRSLLREYVPEYTPFQEQTAEAEVESVPPPQNLKLA